VGIRSNLIQGKQPGQQTAHRAPRLTTTTLVRRYLQYHQHINYIEQYLCGVFLSKQVSHVIELALSREI